MAAMRRSASLTGLYGVVCRCAFVRARGGVVAVAGGWGWGARTRIVSRISSHLFYRLVGIRGQVHDNERRIFKVLGAQVSAEPSGINLEAEHAAKGQRRGGLLLVFHRRRGCLLRILIANP